MITLSQQYELEQARDLAREARQRATQRRREERNQTIECPHCKEDVKRGALKSHTQTFACTAIRNEHALREAGFSRISESGFDERCIREAGIEIRREHTSWERAAKNRKARLMYDTWAPTWVVKLLGDDSYRMRLGFSADEALPHFAIVLREAHANPQTREALFGALRMQGPEGLGRLMLTNAVRAKKMRADAAKLRAQAAALEHEAEALDPQDGGA